MNILHLVRADAERRLSGALKSRKAKRAAAALQEIVEASLPATYMPHERIRRAHPMASGPHRVWRWVSATGMVHLIAEALPDWESVAVTVRLTHPGLSGKGETIFRDVTDDPKRLGDVVASAIRQLKHRLG